jgi:hypothetical protein
MSVPSAWLQVLYFLGTRPRHSSHPSVSSLALFWQCAIRLPELRFSANRYFGIDGSNPHLQFRAWIATPQQHTDNVTARGFGRSWKRRSRQPKPPAFMDRL